MKKYKFAAAVLDAADPRDPTFICYAEEHVRQLDVDKKCWVVSHTDEVKEIQVFDKSHTRDQVRSRYASILGCKIQDVRCRRLENY
jgi:hypothetical protein